VSYLSISEDLLTSTRDSSHRQHELVLSMSNSSAVDSQRIQGRLDGQSELMQSISNRLDQLVLTFGLTPGREKADQFLRFPTLKNSSRLSSEHQLCSQSFVTNIKDFGIRAE
jgi:hypothetical protein